MSDLWYYAEGDTTNGPLSSEELVEFLKRKPDAGDVLVWQPGFRNWVKAASVPELARLLAIPPPLPSKRGGRSKREYYDDAKRALSEIHYVLDTQPLTEKERSELKLHAAALSGQLLSPWFPVYWSRRLIMAAIFLFGIQQSWTGNYEPLLWWLLLPTFSPRIVGECAFFAGRVARLFEGKGWN
jgi:hypothetical protein